MIDCYTIHEFVDGYIFATGRTRHFDLLAVQMSFPICNNIYNSKLVKACVMLSLGIFLAAQTTQYPSTDWSPSTASILP